MCHVGIEGTKHEIYITSLLNLISILKKTYKKVEVFFFFFLVLDSLYQKKKFLYYMLIDEW